METVELRARWHAQSDPKKRSELLRKHGKPPLIPAYYGYRASATIEFDGRLVHYSVRKIHSGRPMFSTQENHPDDDKWIYPAIDVEFDFGPSPFLTIRQIQKLRPILVDLYRPGLVGLTEDI